MDSVDAAMLRNERDASPERFASIHAPNTRVRPSNEVERIASSTSSISSSEGSGSRRQSGMSRVATQRDLERHPTELSRIHTAKSQHSATVGQRHLTSRSHRSAAKPLPEFGAGKPFPPPLPDQEEYVVEFDGPNDPMHAQNWPMKKK